MPTRLALVAAATAIALSCTPAQQPCTTAQDCGGGEVCLQIGTCAPSCLTGAQCGSGEKCSAGGGCVEAARCGADADCASSFVCDPAGACVEHCNVVGCASGETCEPSGLCKPTPVGDAGSTASESCGGQLFQATRVQANFLIVLDHSGSMMSSVGGTPKWYAAVDAVKSITQQHDAAIRFGLQLFSFDGAQCNAGTVSPDVGDHQAAAIAAQLPGDADGNGTPIAGALKKAQTSAGLMDTSRSNNVLLITDGQENCGGNPVAEVKALFARGVKTYVVGFGGGVDEDNLSEMALEGGTALPGATKYYQADDPAALNAAMQQVAQGAIGCDFKLGEVPPDPSKIFVYVNGQLQTRDPAKQSGWEYNAATNRVGLYGATCSIVANDAGAKVNVVYGCPDNTLVEGGGGGGSESDAGTPPDEDGGSIIN